jgi:hypothetical protein
MSTKTTSSGRITKAIIKKLEDEPHSEGLSTDLGLLEKVLLQAKEAYYNTDKPVISDSIYDILIDFLRIKNPKSKLHNIDIENNIKKN